MTAPSSIARDSIAQDAGTLVRTLSEIEKFQYKFRSTKWVYYVFAGMIVASYFGPGSMEDWICAVIIELSGFLSLMLWARRQVVGVPIMPVYAGLSIVFYGLLFVGGHPALEQFNFEEKLFAATTVAAILLIMTVVWAYLGRRQRSRVGIIKTLPGEKLPIRIMLVCLAGSIVFNSNLLAQLTFLPTEVYGVIRAVLVSLGVLSLFSLGYFAGTGALSGSLRYLFFAMAAILVLFQMTSLYLVTSAQHLAALAFGYFLGSGRLPWKIMLASLAVLLVLQAGKLDTRNKYWGDGEGKLSTVSAIELIAEWSRAGLTNLINPGESNSNVESVPLLQRMSLIQMLLKTQTEAPDAVPYLYGQSYSLIPMLLIPRMIWPERPNTSESLVQLNITYGLMTRESAETVSIGWGMIAESYANFGFLGCIGFAILFGSALGVAQRELGRYPLLSARGMAGLLVVFALLAVESSTAQFVTTIAQSLFPLVLLSFAVMRSTRVSV